MFFTDQESQKHHFYNPLIPLSFAYMSQSKAARGASDFSKHHTDQGPSPITLHISGHKHILLGRLVLEALTIPGTVVY